MSSEAVVLRPARIFPLLGGLAGLGFGGYLLLVGQGGLDTLIGLAMILAGILVFVNYTWFHYVAIDEERIVYSKYFGFLRKLIPLKSLTSVRSRPLNTSFGVLRSTPSVRFQWQGGVIELNPVSYWGKPMKRALLFLRARGVEIDDKLLRVYEIE
jgi:hypothetical protein